MPECEYCKRPLDAGTNDGKKHHTYCFNMRVQREVNGKCIGCGIDMLNVNYDVICDKCIQNEGWKNYPGSK